jgi:hypothetical protein
MEGWDINQRRYRLGQIPAETGMDTHCLEYLSIGGVRCAYASYHLHCMPNCPWDFRIDAIQGLTQQAREGRRSLEQ